MKPLTDPFNRRLSYLRLSVTDLCNYRCNYCLPNGYQGKAKPDELSLAEISTLVRVFAASGTRHIHHTGLAAGSRHPPPSAALCVLPPPLPLIVTSVPGLVVVNPDASS